MKLSFIVLLVFSIDLVCPWPQELLHDFYQWATEFEVNTTYACDADRNRAIANFKKNKENIENFNKTLKDNSTISFSMGLWEYSFLSKEEVSLSFNGLRLDTSELETKVESRAIFTAGYQIVSPALTDFDWTNEGAVIIPPRSQQGCACCYAFAATGALEGQIFRKQGVLQRLSTQQLVDCSSDYGNAGCNWGNPVNVYKYIKDNGIAAGYSYMFQGQELGKCHYNETQKIYSVRDYRFIRINSNDFLRDLLYSVGPLVVGVNSRLFSFQNYQKGVYDDPECTGGVDHAMVLTGFGTDEQYGDFWIVKNSYGRNWGEKGFIRMSRKVNNFCGLWEMVVFPVFVP